MNDNSIISYNVLCHILQEQKKTNMLLEQMLDVQVSSLSSAPDHRVSTLETPTETPHEPIDNRVRSNETTHPTSSTPPLPVDRSFDADQRSLYSSQQPVAVATSSQQPVAVLTSSQHPDAVVTSSQQTDLISRHNIASSQQLAALVTSSQRPDAVATSSQQPERIPRQHIASSQQPDAVATSSQQPVAVATSSQQPVAVLTFSQQTERIPRQHIASSQHPDAVLTSSQPLNTVERQELTLARSNVVATQSVAVSTEQMVENVREETPRRHSVAVSTQSIAVSTDPVVRHPQSFTYPSQPTTPSTQSTAVFTEPVVRHPQSFTFPSQPTTPSTQSTTVFTHPGAGPSHPVNTHTQQETPQAVLSQLGASSSQQQSTLIPTEPSSSHPDTPIEPSLEDPFVFYDTNINIQYENDDTDSMTSEQSEVHGLIRTASGNCGVCHLEVPTVPFGCSYEQHIVCQSCYDRLVADRSRCPFCYETVGRPRPASRYRVFYTEQNQILLNTTNMTGIERRAHINQLWQQQQH